MGELVSVRPVPIDDTSPTAHDHPIINSSSSSTSSLPQGTFIIWEIVSFCQTSAWLGLIAPLPSDLRIYFQKFGFSLGAYAFPMVSATLLNFQVYNEQDLQISGSASSDIGKYMENLNIPWKVVFPFIFGNFFYIEVLFILLWTLGFILQEMMEKKSGKDFSRIKANLLNFFTCGSLRIRLVSITGLCMSATYQWMIGGPPIVIFLSCLSILAAMVGAILFGYLVVKHASDLYNPTVIAKFGCYFQDYRSDCKYFFMLDNTACFLVSISLGVISGNSIMQVSCMGIFHIFQLVCCLYFTPFRNKFRQHLRGTVLLIQLIQLIIVTISTFQNRSDWLVLSGIYLNMGTIIFIGVIVLGDLWLRFSAIRNAKQAFK